MTLEELNHHRKHFDIYRDLPRGVMLEVFDAAEASIISEKVNVDDQNATEQSPKPRRASKAKASVEDTVEETKDVQE